MNWILREQHRKAVANRAEGSISAVNILEH